MTQNLLEKDVCVIECASVLLRRGYPIVMQQGRKSFCMTSAECITPKMWKMMQRLVEGDVFLVLMGKRANALLQSDKKLPKIIKVPLSKNMGCKEIKIFAGGGVSLGVSRSFQKLFSQKLGATAADEAAVTLTRIAELLPVVLIGEAKKSINKQGFPGVLVSEVEKFEESVAYSMCPAVTAPLTLANASQASITVFRPNVGNKEHYAIEIGKRKKGKIPLVRIHSSCFTGDVLASLKCDCRDQLQEAIKIIAQEGWGFVLYLMQEGRGIGLANKLKTYALQATGMDTLEANEFLGFDDDERPFLPAAEMLKMLGQKKIRLLTNNPRKIKGLEAYGIVVAERVDHHVEPGKHNAHYLATKFSKLGHVKHEKSNPR